MLDHGSRSVLWILLVAKLLVLSFGVQAYTVLQNAPAGSWLEIWNRWDAPHYLDIANDGYVAEGEARRWIVFFPLFPWLVRGVKFIARDPILSAFIVSTIASFVAAWLLYRLAKVDEEEPVARDAVFFLAIFPTSYFLHIGYTESLFLALSTGAFLAARRGRWMAAGLVGALAALARVNGVLLVPVLALEAWSEYRRTRRFDPRWLWILVIGSGFAAYLAINKTVAGSWFAFRIYQRDFWNRKLAMPWVSLHDAWLSIHERNPFESVMVGWQELFFTLLAIAATVWCWMKLRPSYALWATLNILLWTSTGFLLSAPRYALTVFPLYFCFALITRDRPVFRTAVIVWSVFYLGLFTALFVTGKWAF